MPPSPALPAVVLPSRPAASRALRALRAALPLFLLACSACSLLDAAPPPAPAPAPPPAPVAAPEPPPVQKPPADPATAADLVARRVLAYDEQLRIMAPPDLANEITRLGTALSAADPATPPDVVLDLSLALSRQHNAGDLARAAGLLDPLTQAARPELLPWQPLARLVADHIAEQRRLDDLAERQSAQLRDTQRTILQLTEKLEALKAIERSMIKRTGPGSGGETTSASPAH